MITGFGKPVQASREYYLDWLRLAAILAVFFHHAAKFFDFDSFTLFNPARSLAASAFREANALWMMPLFFVVSGAAVHFSLKTRGAGEFLKERILRILVPLAVLGTFVINPPQVYLTRLFNGDYDGSFLLLDPPLFPGNLHPGRRGQLRPPGLRHPHVVPDVPLCFFPAPVAHVREVRPVRQEPPGPAGPKNPGTPGPAPAVSCPSRPPRPLTRPWAWASCASPAGGRRCPICSSSPWAMQSSPTPGW